MTRLASGSALTGAVLMILAGALFAVDNTLVQYIAMVKVVPPGRIAFWQYAIALLAALPWLATRGLRALRTAHFGWHVARVGLAALGARFWVAGLAHVPIWQAIALVILSPFFVTLGAGLVLRERVGAERWLAVTVGFLGGMILLQPWSKAFTPQALLPVLAAVFWAFSSLMTKRMTRFESAEGLTLYLLLLLTPLNAALGWSQGLAITAATAPLLVGTGLLTALANFTLIKAYAVADAAYLQPFDHVKLPFNVVLGLAVFGFVPPGSLWLGASLIVGASFYMMRREARPAFG